MAISDYTVMVGSNLKEINKAAASIQGTVHHSHTSFRNNHATVNPQTGILNSIKEELSTKEKKSSHAVLSKIMCYKGQWGDTSNKYCVFSHASRVHHLDGGFPSLVLG